MSITSLKKALELNTAVGELATAGNAATCVAVFWIVVITKGVTSNSTTDEVVKTGRGAMGSYGTTGVQNYRRYWGESDMSKALGADELLHDDDVDYEEAKDEFAELGIEDPAEQDERAKQMGFDPSLPDDKVRLVENPKKFMDEYIESILKKKNEDSEIGRAHV